jgi:hypothetical protein
MQTCLDSSNGPQGLLSTITISGVSPYTKGNHVGSKNIVLVC